MKFILNNIVYLIFHVNNADFKYVYLTEYSDFSCISTLNVLPISDTEVAYARIKKNLYFSKRGTPFLVIANLPKIINSKYFLVNLITMKFFFADTLPVFGLEKAPLAFSIKV